MHVVKVVTHHEDQETAARLFAEEGVVAIGWSEIGNYERLTRDEIKAKARRMSKEPEQSIARTATQMAMFRDKVKVGDIVFAYKGNNKVALVGEIASRYRYNTRNRVGDLRGHVQYPNQREVKWWKNPRNFDRSFLPTELSDWVAIPGTIAVKEYDTRHLGQLKRELQRVPSEEMRVKALEILNENEIKDYVRYHPEAVEPGLTIVEKEYSTSEGPMDFLAKDASGLHVVIEAKVMADDNSVTQTRRYIRALKREKKIPTARGIIVAQEFKKRCVDDAREWIISGQALSLYRCRKEYRFTAVDTT